VFLESFVSYECRKYEEASSDPDKRIVDCYLMYDPYPPNPYASKFSFAELQHVHLGGG
jgi:hypothetical protein